MRNKIPILLYHSIARDASPQFRRWTLSPKHFSDQMNYLVEQNYTPITVTHLVTALTDSNVQLPVRPVILTFDDGFADFYTDALPILKSSGFAATLYIATGFVGGTSRWLYAQAESSRLMLTWEQILEISTNGVEIGGHGISHKPLDVLPYGEAWNEIISCKTDLDNHLHQRTSTFAYPHGYYSPSVRQAVQQAGYLSACAVKHAMSSTVDDPFALSRIVITADTDLARFIGLLSGSSIGVAPNGQRLRTRVWRSWRRAIRIVKRLANHEIADA